MIKYFQRAFTNQANTSENLFLRLSSINSYINQQILVRGRLQKSRIKGNIGFLVLRQQLNTIQCCVVKTDEIDKSVKCKSLLLLNSVPPIRGLGRALVPVAKLDIAYDF